MPPVDLASILSAVILALVTWYGRKIDKSIETVIRHDVTLNEHTKIIDKLEKCPPCPNIYANQQASRQ